MSEISGGPLSERGPGIGFNLNASISDQSCPGQWNLITTPVRGCAGANVSCHSAFSEVGDNYFYDRADELGLEKAA